MYKHIERSCTQAQENRALGTRVLLDIYQLELGTTVSLIYAVVVSVMFSIC